MIFELIRDMYLSGVKGKRIIKTQVNPSPNSPAANWDEETDGAAALNFHSRGFRPSQISAVMRKPERLIRAAIENNFMDSAT